MSEITTHEALVYVMVTMSAVDSDMTDAELAKIGNIIKSLPVFAGFSEDQLVGTAEKCSEMLAEEGSLNKILDIAASLPAHLHETAYALAVDVAAADLRVVQEEIRFLQLLRDKLNVDKLIVAAIERGARARHEVI